MASTGTIVTHVYTSRAMLPVAGATVAFTQEGETAGKRHLLALRISDESGRTTPVSLDTPPTDASQFPGGETPFSVCNILAVAAGYEMLAVRDVQVFPGTETLQKLELIPLPEQAPPQSRVERVDIPPQDL